MHGHVIKPIVPAEMLDDDTITISSTGRLFIGPQGDSGLTDVKIINRYLPGGMARHGGLSR